ncbi:polysaccharide deacetylase family protein [Streptomyces sp. H27-D2]|uniref:polysaccharide deacetylase family protein n=1 Tax=Streptomyces sp. H27-D2 TaxID=3046304 RepID=UPI002DBCC051|nr:polysaccharide deacetylase family protein [Streptomyces sp. H27-D2]MEC4017507.1 polysaccharide deacetylase family protein [Streptomyces sp. H27-D2]
MARQGTRGVIIAAVSAAAVTITGAGLLAFTTTGAGSAPRGPRQIAEAKPAAPGGAPAAPIAGQTSAPDPKLPAPRVNMDISHAPEGGGKNVNITIDDGPDPVWTPRVLELLKARGVKATFCMVGPQAAAHPELVLKVVRAGHRLCDHTVSHDTAMDEKSTDYQFRQILDAKKMIEKAAGGAKVRYYRAPGGAFTPQSRQLAAAHGMRPLGWNIDSKDFQRPGYATIVQTVKNELSNGPTILFHDGGGDRSQTVEALREVLPWIEGQGYGFAFPQG